MAVATKVEIRDKAHGLELLKAGQITVEQYAAYDAVKSAADIAAAVAAAAPPPGELSCKVSEKGAVSVYGLNSKWPVTLYGEQWGRLAAYMPKVTEFLAANKSKLSTKEQSKIRKAAEAAELAAKNEKADNETDEEFRARRAAATK